MNIYDVAKLAGVSIATVSRVVNDSPRVSEKTKRRVLAIIEESDYTPNVFARGLGLDSMKTIGIMCPDISDEYMAHAVSHLEHRLRAYEYDCILYCSGYEQKNKEKSVNLLLAKRIDALVLVGSIYAGDGDDESETEYIRNAAKQIPVFMINGKIPGDNIYCGYCDDKQVTYEVTTELIRTGRKRILFLSDSYSYSANQKLEGYEEALRDAAYPVLGDLKLYTKNDIHYVRDMLLARKDLDFDSVVATDDGLAVGALKYAAARKITVPQDMCVVGYNDSALSVSCEPELTSVDNQVEKICNNIVDDMIKILQGSEDFEKEHSVPGKIIKRCTTDF
ncbi:LacI family DNA-binding transcriptional regulator [Hespellia stercorisuis]|uniref:Transcriptional regulator, LacI family n=1 Tax=Hespellia stercorisuis DSM 15480 TaxID=1121950 RepID=A0A1M6UQ47_9FIRM|nr:LacI family DNA-binding transcriptional regulator [Hespellia stercorisuis]SHK71279.1 transcriptional regulator, LacI family [Hespellia stercorisuis DSM 15480]